MVGENNINDVSGILSLNSQEIPRSEEDKEKFSIKPTPIVFIPVPYDGTSTYNKGADKGPKALLDAYPNMEFYEIETGVELYPESIFVESPILENSSPEKMVEAVSKKVKEHIKNKAFVVTIGGEHSVSIGAINEHAKKYKNMSVLQFDAHADLRDEYHGSKYNHACVMRRAQQVAKTVQVGIRSVAAEEKDAFQKVFFAHEIVGKKDIVWDIINSLTDNVYITIDLDVFDSSIMPSTGTPEPGGLDWYDMMRILKEVAKEKKIVGLDIVELLPKKEDPAPDFLAAKLLFKTLAYRQYYK